jgi:uncharacterized protein (DUF362 family)/ferredoxin
MSTVGIKKCKSYSEGDIKESFNELIAGFDKEKIYGKKIIIFFDFPQPDIEILKRVIEFLKENGATKISAGTSIFIKDLPESIQTLFKNEKIEFIDFRKDNYEKTDVSLRKTPNLEHFRGFAILSPVQYATEKAITKMETPSIRTLKSVFLPASFSENDYVVAITKMKDSPLAKLGGFVNSMTSLITTKTRAEIFVNAMQNKQHESLLEIFSLMKNKVLFGVVDGVKASISNNKEINQMKVLLFSDDLLSLDSVTSVLIGFRSNEIETNRLGDIFRFGSGTFNHITLYGDDFVEIRKEATKMLRYSKVFGKRNQPIPKITKEDKLKINKSMDFCPTGAIIEKEGSYLIDKNKCIKCYFCVEIAGDVFKI